MIKDKHIWITGATSGIGKALAENLYRANNHIIISGRNHSQMKAMQEQMPGIELLPLDLNQNSTPLSTEQRLRALTDRLDMAIINAGVCEYVEYGQLDIELFKRVFEVNYFGAVRCAQAAMPLLERSHRPQLVLISSQSVLAPMPRAEAYGASKAALEYTFEALGHDLEHTGLDISIVRLGFIKTPLTDSNDFPMPFLMTPQTLSNRILEGISKRQRIIEAPKRLSWLLKLLSSKPLNLFQFVAPRMVRKKEF